LFPQKKLTIPWKSERIKKEIKPKSRGKSKGQTVPILEVYKVKNSEKELIKKYIHNQETSEDSDKKCCAC
jgi:hypothetical protein